MDANKKMTITEKVERLNDEVRKEEDSFDEKIHEINEECDLKREDAENNHNNEIGKLLRSYGFDRHGLLKMDNECAIYEGHRAEVIDCDEAKNILKEQEKYSWFEHGFYMATPPKNFVPKYRRPPQ